MPRGVRSQMKPRRLQWGLGPVDCGADWKRNMLQFVAVVRSGTDHKWTNWSAGQAL